MGKLFLHWVALSSTETEVLNFSVRPKSEFQRKIKFLDKISVFFLQTSLCLYVFCMLYCIVRFSSTTFALVPLIIGRQLVELCVFLATCHIAFKYVYLLANKVIV